MPRAAPAPRGPGGMRGRENLLSHPHPELGPPRDLPAGGLRITPLGGLGEIGRNMTVFEYGGKLLIVGCGVLFPEEGQTRGDLILPHFRCIPGRPDDVVGILLPPRPPDPNRARPL